MNKRKLLILVVILFVAAFGASTLGYFLLYQYNNEIPFISTTVHGTTTIHPDTEDNDQTSNMSTPLLQYPSIVGSNYIFEDYSTLDDLVAMRRFTIPNKYNNSMMLLTAYRTYFSNNPYGSKIIATLADQNAAFVEIYQQTLAPSSHWQSIVVHVGGFTQDNCGDIDIVYTLDNSSVTALFIDNSHLDAILRDSQCQNRPDDPQSEEFIYGRFCNERSSCLQKYFTHPDNKQKLQSDLLNIVRELPTK